MANYPIPVNPDFNTTMRKFETDDPAHADLFNATIQKLLDNDNFLNEGMTGMEAITEAEIDALDGSAGGGSGEGTITGSEITAEDIDNII